MSKVVKKGTWWTYYGPGEGNGQHHMVIGVDGGYKGITVTTWSALNCKGSGGQSWRGDAVEFARWFSELQYKL